MNDFKDILKRIGLITLITVIFLIPIVGGIFLFYHSISNTESEEVIPIELIDLSKADLTQIIDTYKCPLLYSYESDFGYVVNIYQIKADHISQRDEHVYSLAFTVDGEFQFVCDITYFTRRRGALESTPPYLGDLPKEKIKGGWYAGDGDPKRDDFWISIDKYYNRSYDVNKQYELYYTFAEDGPKLWTNLKEEDIQIINKSLTVSFAE